MKYIITESQYRILNEETEEILELPFKMFNNDWNFLQEYIEMIGNPPYIITGNLNLRGLKVITLGSLVGVEGYLDLSDNRTFEDLGNLQSVGGFLYLSNTSIESLGNLQSVGGYLNLKFSKIQSLGNLKSVGGYLDLSYTNIESLGNLQSVGGDLRLRNCEKLKNLGNLQYVGGYLDLEKTPLSKTTTKEEILNIPSLTIVGKIYL